MSAVMVANVAAFPALSLFTVRRKERAVNPNAATATTSEIIVSVGKSIPPFFHSCARIVSNQRLRVNFGQIGDYDRVQNRFGL